MTNTVNAVQYPRAGRSKAEFWAGVWRCAIWFGVVGSFLWLNNYHNQRFYAVTTAKAAAAKKAADEKKRAIAEALKEGNRLGRHVAIGRAKALVEQERYAFHGVHKIRGKLYALLTGPAELEPQLYRLDSRQFPTGFPGEGGVLLPVTVNGYFVPLGGRPVAAKSAIARPVRKTVTPKPASPRKFKPRAIQFSPANLPRDWPTRFPALPPANLAR